MGRLFGTDGARGVAGTELTPELAMNIGRAAACVLTESTHRPKFLIGKDTRQSSDMLEAALAAGLCAVGADVMILGVVPTPAVAYLVKKYACDAGVMISASHNPCEFNGIKIFQGTGYKLPDEIENRIEAIILDGAEVPPVKTGGDVGRITYADTAVEDYIAHICTASQADFSGMKVAFDCANGSSSATALKLFKRLGIEGVYTAYEPNGTNINDGCGSTHLEALKKTVLENGCELGFAFDGDADRMLAVDENGQEVDGDKIIAICAKYMKENGNLKNDTAVVTVMSNMGFFKFCEENDIRCEKTSVGDRYVLENMLANGHNIGGEQSGHVIFLDYATTGDGQLSAVMLLNVLKHSGKKLSELASQMQVYPQVLVNVKVTAAGKAAYAEDTVISQRINEAEKQMGDTGRVLVRLSGTEPLIRVMLEGKDLEQITAIANDIAGLVKERLA
ncbi:MAG: phosphoglucosamine mutase [Clostridia bacterium]|nr:phosphoglucosamine mutase [Clostridia bacterium]